MAVCAMNKLVCEDCGTVYYSAAAKTMAEQGETCAKCGGRARPPAAREKVAAVWAAAAPGRSGEGVGGRPAAEDRQRGLGRELHRYYGAVLHHVVAALQPQRP